MAHSPEVMPVSVARTLFLQGQGLLEDASRPAHLDAVMSEIERLGFVQLDSINIVERAHHHILWARLRGYRPQTLDALQRTGRVFEHWTHDASVIPSLWFPHWRHRFGRIAWGAWLRGRLGPGHRRVLEGVIERVRREGPLMARDFEHPGRRSGPWWDWKPAKAALEYWWRRGELAIPHRVRFEKVYDLTERVLPEVHGLRAPDRAAHVDWACRGALDRLGAATPRELAGFWGLVTIAQAQAWGARALKRGEVIPVRIEGHGSSIPALAPVDWRRRAAAARAAPREMRMLSPFDPLVRDRARCLRLFGFDYRFEAFVPETRRKHGYYVLPILQGGGLVGRLDPKLDRQAGVLRIRRVWWEPGVKPGRARAGELEAALNQYASLVGAATVEIAANGR